MLYKLPNGRSLRLETDSYDLTSSTKPNLNWKHVDTHGHVHQWELGGNSYESLPTARVVQVGFFGIEVAACVHCGDTFEPGYVLNAYPVRLQGLAHSLNE